MIPTLPALTHIYSHVGKRVRVANFSTECPHSCCMLVYYNIVSYTETVLHIRYRYKFSRGCVNFVFFVVYYSPRKQSVIYVVIRALEN